MDTPRFDDTNFGFWGLAFWVVAPPAVERATFQEHGGANSRPIMQGEALDLKNIAAQRHLCVETPHKTQSDPGSHSLLGFASSAAGG